MTSFFWPPLTASNGGVTSVNSLTGAITIAAGTGISVTSGGSTITVATATTPQVLAPGATVAYNMALGTNATLAPVQNFTLSNPTNLVAGMSGALTITQDGVGSRTITYGSAYKFPGGVQFVLSTGAGAIDTLAWYSPDGTTVQMVGQNAFA